MSKIIIGEKEIETKDKSILDVLYESLKDVNLNILDFVKLEDELLMELSNNKPHQL